MFNYVVYTRLGMNIEQLMQSRAGGFTKKQIYSFGIQVLNILEKIHNAGYVYNDLKLDNVLLDMYDMTDLKDLVITETDIFDKMNLNIANYDFVSPWLDRSTKEHVSK